ncbi:hypothetical protein FKW77_008655 [Venturia effusa]|uniref:cAMP-independent regulatory protein pac2 n=1 Tax=Venturia effusa TaxID=50376 RepID=A0A517L7X0_9PEZI|nr:hypothetical protein FKW77_008655 [Venturia effusa]
METYHGKVQTPQDAIILFEACRLGLTPRVQRRLSEKERQQIKSGSVFVWDEREAGMRRWTDGKSWSASRVSGSFLTYREMEGKRGGPGAPPAATPPASLRKSSSGTRSPGNSNNGGSDEEEEGPDGYRYKPDGLMKQSFSITTQDGRHLHLISYFARNPSLPLKQPTTDPALRNIVPQKGMYPDAAVNEVTNIPAVTRGPLVATSPQPSAHPHPQPHMFVAYPYPPPPGYSAGPIHHYPPQAWPPSPGHLAPGVPPPGAFFYPPPPGYVYPSSPYAHSPYPYAHPSPHAAHERGPPSLPPSSLPPLHGQTHPPAGQWAPPAARPSSATYAQSMPRAASLQESYNRSAAEQRSDETSRAPGPQLAPVAAFQNKPPTPPASRNGATPPAKTFADPPPIRDASTAFASEKTFPSIKALIHGEITTSRREEDRTRTRSRSRSPIGSRIRDVPSAMAAGGRERDRSDLKRLDAQLLKS